MYGHSFAQSDFAILDSVRRHLLGESDPGLTVSTATCNSTATAPPPTATAYCRSSSFGCLDPCLTDTWGDLPLKENDSEDMLVYNFLRDALTEGWVPVPQEPTSSSESKSPKRRRKVGGGRSAAAQAGLEMGGGVAQVASSTRVEELMVL
ncbi:hypothetical protein Pint_15805 [Pistacia integerrima]|uniref:Uncharacterized protein n=1 Tax=Pistacia integerrima TaxID=434235 RepID=A0ACC0ZCS6_9ROSI|nr:hypothetical protein Pint_15805 [Pistacia integerrima]